MLDKLLGIKPKLACDLCGKKVLHMKSHMKKMHGEGRPGCVVECGQCDRTILLSDMTDHVLNYHIRLERSPSPHSGEEQQFSLKDWVKGDNVKQSASQPSPNSSQVMNECSQEVCHPKSSQEEVQIPEAINSNIMKGHDKNIFEGSEAGKDSEVLIRDSSSSMMSISKSSRKPPPPSTMVPTTDDNQSPSNNIQECKDKVFKSFLCDDSDDTDDSDISIVEIVPPVSNITDYNQNPHPQPGEGKVQFLVKSKERNIVGGKVKSMRLVMRPTKTVGQAKRRYGIKQGLDRDRLGELQLMVERRRLEEQEQVGQLDNKIVMAKGLSFGDRRRL